MKLAAIMSILAVALAAATLSSCGCSDEANQKKKPTYTVTAYSPDGKILKQLKGVATFYANNSGVSIYNSAGSGVFLTASLPVTVEMETDTPVEESSK